MIQTFHTIDEAAEKLRDRGYTYETVQALVAEGRVPYHVRDLTILIPFPEAESCFPPLPAKTPEPQKPASPPAEEEPKAAPKRVVKKPKD